MKRVVAIVISLIVVISSAAQDIEQLTKADPVAWSGGLTWSNIFTWPKDSARQVPTYSYYISGSLNTTIFGVVSVPISFAYTNNELSSTITYPFNRFSLTPSYKWVKLHIGYSQMTFSPYTMSGHDFLGGGVELTPDEMPWQFSAFFGRLNKAVPSDSINTEPIYKRMGGGIMGGYKGERWSLLANTINYYYMGIGHGTPCLKVTLTSDMTINGTMVAKGYVTAYSDASTPKCKN